MERSDILEAVKRKVTSLSGVIAFEYLKGEFKEKLVELEHEAEKNGACGGLMPFTNRGVWMAFDRQVQFVIVASSSAMLLGISDGLVYIEDQKGQIVGEWLNAKRQEELKDRKDLCFLSEDFVLYPDVEVSGEPFFVLPEVAFPYLKGIRGVKNVASGSISTLADDFIRARLGYGETKHWTHLVGFDLDTST
ncbi:MAG: hypothetical protein LUO79_05260 [Methanomassiliicoccales archaeon]|nr:hypothetical protein [Methanomassiliicoccales archaeon]